MPWTPSPLRLLRATWPATLALVACLALPGTAHAQLVPVQDQRMWLERGINMVGRMGDWFMTANYWLTETRNRTDAAIHQTERIRSISRRYEDAAIGELGSLGDAVTNRRTRDDARNEGTDEFGAASVCGMSRTASTLCTEGRQLRQRYERVMGQAVNQLSFNDSTILAAGRDSVETELYDLLGPGVRAEAIASRSAAGFGMGLSAPARAGAARAAGVPAVTGGPDVALTRPLEMARLQGEQSAKLQEATKRLAAVVDSVTRYETATGQKVSSGRARQLEASLAYAEGLVELELARSAARALDTYVVSTANTVRDARTGQYTALRSLRGM